MKTPLAYLYEEFCTKSGDLKKSYLWSFHPNQLSYLNDLKNTTHHIKITPLFAGEPVEAYNSHINLKERRSTMWTKPAATEMRFGFEVTMYVMNK